MSSSDVSDVLILGDGLVGLACARAVAARGLSLRLVGRRRPGVASIAAAGFLAPTIDPARGGALDFALAARERYVTFVDDLRAVTGRDVPLALDGIVRVASTEREAASMMHASDAHSRWLTSTDVADLEPALVAPLGARFHPEDGWVDNQRLVQALDEAVALDGIARIEGEAVRVETVGEAAVVELDTGARLRTRFVVIAAGAWSPLVQGLPKALPVRPLRGQMMALAADPPVRRPIFGHGGYLVPRPLDRQVLVGSTAEAVGYVTGTTDAALVGFRQTAGLLVPSLARADEARTWSGLRPMTLDGLPIIGRDPDIPSILYACGHSKNGILFAPLTGDIIGDLAAGGTTRHDLAPFSVRRFADRAEVRS